MSADFVHAFSALFSASANPELLRTLVQHHHESAANFPPSLLVAGIEDPHIRALATIISQADHFSASERGEGAEQWQDFKSTALASVMEQVRIPEESPEKENHVAPTRHFHARPLNGPGNESFGDVFPENFDAYEPGEMNSLLKDFGDDFKRWANRNEPPDFEMLLNHLLHFLYKYAWCVPSNTQEAIPDVSIYDHLKTTAAIAACLYMYHDDKHKLNEKSLRDPDQKRFCLVAGDVSGIQKYIFAISNIGAGGVARKLRSRSLFVQLVTEVCAHKILNAFGLPLANFLMSAGGNFHLLVPNVSGAAAVLGKVNQEIDQWFLQELNGELALNLASFNFDGPGFSASADTNDGFGGVLRTVNDRLAQVKQKRFTSLWVSDGKWQKERFTVSQDFKGQEACRSCGKFPREDNEDVCTHCKLDRETGKDLPNRNSIVFYAGEGKGEIPLPYGSAAVISGGPRGSIPPYLTLKLNSSDLGSLNGFAAQSKFIANYVPKGVDGPMTFEDIAQKASGRRYLGFLKMDADNMGMAMVFGLKREKPEQGRDTISRLATLSRQIDWFFSGWVQHLLETKFKNCYTVFSGGDDLFVVGPWDETLELADIIDTDYYEYTFNDQLTISAGIVIAGDSYPISRAAEDAEEAVKESKNKGRDSITLLGHTLKWNEWAEVKKKWGELRDKLEPEKISTAFLYSLLEYGRMWKKYKSGDTVGLRFQPLLAYNVGRNLSARDSPTFYQWAQEIISLKLADMQRKHVILDNLGLLAQLLILGKGGTDDTK